MITGGGFGSACSSGSGGDVRNEPQPKDPARGKGLVVKEETAGEVPVERVEFRPIAESSGHRPITRGDFA